MATPPGDHPTWHFGHHFGEGGARGKWHSGEWTCLGLGCIDLVVRIEARPMQIHLEFFGSPSVSAAMSSNSNRNRLAPDNRRLCLSSLASCQLWGVYCPSSSPIHKVKLFPMPRYTEDHITAAMDAAKREPEPCLDVGCGVSPSLTPHGLVWSLRYRPVPRYSRSMKNFVEVPLIPVGPVGS